MSDGAAGKPGSLLIIGGSEDREDARHILERFVTLCGGPAGRIAVLTAASKIGELVWQDYQRAFAQLGAHHCVPIHIESRAAANHPAMVAAIDSADGIFMTGGDQKRLLSLVGGTAVAQALHAALARGACVAGTSAGASAMSDAMLTYGRARLKPVKGTVGMGKGLGFLHGVIIDQHFSQRRRLSRLLTVVAQNRSLIGIGIDEDTALLIGAGEGIEIIGAGTVTVVDGRSMVTDIDSIDPRAVPEMLDVRLHILPAGRSHRIAGGAQPGALSDFLHLATRIVQP
ncbi:cyanophycinase [Massilia sp. PAMC28688]|uniref:cyanophycinase n=1 Tax=Massilia sp. PAMC28688 TaxID=2861283 RepID=UPI001C62B4AC|nr:cyanophycinase [Massilia sp. PAMC28688]QYF94194.1 cyanophycinase [Massilia sp. PAMC28688]